VSNRGLYRPDEDNHTAICTGSSLATGVSCGCSVGLCKTAYGSAGQQGLAKSRLICHSALTTPERPTLQSMPRMRVVASLAGNFHATAHLQHALNESMSYAWSFCKLTPHPAPGRLAEGVCGDEVTTCASTPLPLRHPGVPMCIVAFTVSHVQLGRKLQRHSPPAACTSTPSFEDAAQCSATASHLSCACSCASCCSNLRQHQAPVA
jgi:hypothetical protein